MLTSYLAKVLVSLKYLMKSYIVVCYDICMDYSKEYYLNVSKAKDDWQNGADEIVSNARKGDSPWIPADSIFRPNNLSLWYNLKSAQPDTFNTNTPDMYDMMMQQQAERVKRAEEEFKRKGR